MVYLVTTTQKIDYPVPKHCDWENYVQDDEKLFLRLSTREKKKRRKGKELPDRQRQLLTVFASDVVSLKVKPKTGFDLLQTLKEMWEIIMT